LILKISADFVPLLLDETKRLGLLLMASVKKTSEQDRDNRIRNRRKERKWLTEKHSAEGEGREPELEQLA
jgi:hypothetical protein